MYLIDGCCDINQTQLGLRRPVGTFSFRLRIEQTTTETLGPTLRELGTNVNWAV